MFSKLRLTEHEAPMHMRCEDVRIYPLPLRERTDRAQRDQVRVRESLRRPALTRRAASRHAALSRKGRGQVEGAAKLIPCPVKIRRRRRAPDVGLAALPGFRPLRRVLMPGPRLEIAEVLVDHLVDVPVELAHLIL